MTDGDKGIPGKVSLRHLKPTAVRGGWVTATDQEEEDSSSERENKGGVLQEEEGSQSLGCGVLLGGQWEQNCLHKELTGVGWS